jgi:hypothetical protein
MKLSDIHQFTSEGHYQVNQSWDSIEQWIARQVKQNGLDLNPDFQRGHVWTPQQQTAYVEFCLKGGKHSSLLRFNCVGWMSDFRGPFVLVDGKQRLEAVRAFLRDQLPVFGGHTISDFDEKDRELIGRRYDFVVAVNSLETRLEVLKWYLDINPGGVVHTDEEIERVRKLAAKEKERVRKFLAEQQDTNHA